MSADIYQFEDGRESFTRREGTKAAWHHLGGETPEDAPLEVWARNAGMDYSINESPVTFDQGDGAQGVYDSRRVQWRSDTLAPLGVVGSNYKTVQPMEVLEFFRDLTESQGFVMDTAGVLKGGAKYWALASTPGTSINLSGDKLKPYLLLATACDGSMSTIGSLIAVRVVCENTLNMALREGGDKSKVSHRSVFNPQSVKLELGIGQSWEAFLGDVDSMASRTIGEREGIQTLWSLFGNQKLGHYIQDVDRAKVPTQTKNKIETVWGYFQGAGDGADLVTAKGTRWGLLNAVTQYVDHDIRARSDENRLDSAWFGAGKSIKDQAYAMLSDAIAA